MKNININKGLTAKEVNERMANNLNYKEISVTTLPIKKIISKNFFTLFNFLNFGLVFLIVLVGQYKNMIFIGTVIFNMVISMIQEIKAKKIVDKLSLLSQGKIVVLRDGIEHSISREQVVLDDLMVLKNGSQVIADSIVMDGECLVNESFITGEDVPIEKKIGDEILSGSFIVGGKAKARVIHIGDDNYTSKISKDAKYIKKVNSVLMNTLNKIIKYISFVIVPTGVLMFLNQYIWVGNDITVSIVTTVAALIGMIPEGLILLTSTVLAVSVIRLGRYNVLVQELYCIETLARVDVLCLDKTGTLTEGIMEVKDMVTLNEHSVKEVEELMEILCVTIDDVSPTMKALKTKFKDNEVTPFKYDKFIPFSSEKKYSKVIVGKTSYYLGAPEYIIKGYDTSKYNNDYRVLMLAKEENNKKVPISLFLLQDKIRKEAKNTLKYFKEQGVEIKIISGDNPITVSGIAKRLDMDDYDKYIDLTGITEKSDLKKAYLSNTIFGRVNPQQKKELILLIKELGHVVAMTGDGVNDCLALKEADCSIAMASGSDAARNVSQLVLMESNFDAMPKVVEEGRRCINNIGRSASLFLTKTIYTMLIVLTVLFLRYQYPFQPIHLSMMNLITIGVPSLVLALEPNKERVMNNFFVKIIANALPTALTVFTIQFLILSFSIHTALTTTEMSTIAVISNTVIMLIYIFKLSYPFNKIRKLMFYILVTIFLVEIMYFNEFFSLARLDLYTLFIVGIVLLASLFMWTFYNYLFERIKNTKKFKKLFE